MALAPTPDARPYDFLVFIGRFQPFHLGHKAVIDRALELSGRVIVLAGSAGRARSLRNPFTWQERSRMILASFIEDERSRILVRPLLDTPYSDADWIDHVHEAVAVAIGDHELAGEPRIGLIGHNKDNSSYYLQMFPQWSAENVARTTDVDATDIRWSYLSGLAAGSQEPFSRSSADRAPAGTLDFLGRFAADKAAKELADEWVMVDGYRKAWATAPYPPTFVTVDAVVIQAGRILVIRRKFAPGRGRLALPGGFVEGHERLEDAVVRELAEETQIDMSAKDLKRLIRQRGVFDAPNRSDRGRTITHGFLFQIPDGAQLTAVSASDDAEQAFWTPIANLDPETMFEDHWDIVQELLRGSTDQDGPLR